MMNGWLSGAAAIRPASVLCCVCLVLLASGCITPEVGSDNPDLIAVPEGSYGGADAYCDFTTVPQLRIGIQNQGQGNAPASMTRVRFSPGGIKDIPTPPLQSAQRTMLPPVPIPAACFDPDCDFTITVDSQSQINEPTGEENNVTDGRCIRP
jgi:hypothetical protein